MTSITPARLTARGIGVRFGEAEILRAVDLLAEPGTVVGLLGPNGSGKSTLLRTIFRSLSPITGQVSLDGEDVWAHSVKWNARQTAVVLQEGASDFPLTCLEIIQMGRTPHKRMLDADSPQDAALCEAAMALVEVSHLAHAPFGQLSGGERQRVLIARALVQQPRLLIMDEPTNHLDLHHQLSLLDLVNRLDTTVVVALHDLNLAARYCDVVVLLDQGRVVAQGAPAEVFTPERIRQVYRVDADVIAHPRTGRPHVMLL